MYLHLWVGYVGIFEFKFWFADCCFGTLPFAGCFALLLVFLFCVVKLGFNAFELLVSWVWLWVGCLRSLFWFSGL